MKTLSSPIDLIKKSFSIFFEKNNLIYFLKIYSLLLPFSIFSLFFGNFTSTQLKVISTSDPNQFLSKYLWVIVLALIVSLIRLFVTFWVSASAILAISGAVSNNRIGVKETFTLAWKKLWNFALLGMVLGLVVGLGFLLLIVPGVIFMVWFSFSSFILINEGLGIKESLSKSKELVAGRFWKVLGRLAVFGIFAVFLQSIVSAIPFVGAIVITLSGALFFLPQYLLYRELKG